MIRSAEIDDFTAIELLAKEFWAHTRYEEDYQDGSALMYIQIAYDHGLLLVSEHDEITGFVAGCATPLMGANSVKSGTELAWWVKPEARNSRDGINLLKAIEQKAKDIGCKYWNMVAMESSMPEHIKRIYKRMGYEKTETTYIRGL